MADSLEAEQSLHDSHSLLMAIRSGDLSALGNLTAELRPYLRQVIQNEMGRRTAIVPDDNSDLIQQTLLKAVRSLSSFRGQSLNEWRLWLAAIARSEVRVAARHWQTQKRAHSADPLWNDNVECQPISLEDSPSTELKRKELATQLSLAMNQLTEAERRIISWRQDSGWSHAKIAEQLGISVDAARQRCKSAMDSLRKHFKQQSDYR